MSVDAVAAELRLEVTARLPGGERPAWAVRDHVGSDLVLKVFALTDLPRVELAVGTAVRVRDRGVPIPDPYVVGVAGSRA